MSSLCEPKDRDVFGLGEGTSGDLFHSTHPMLLRFIANEAPPWGASAPSSSKRSSTCSRRNSKCATSRRRRPMCTCRSRLMSAHEWPAGDTRVPTVRVDEAEQHRMRNRDVAQRDWREVQFQAVTGSHFEVKRERPPPPRRRLRVEEAQGREAADCQSRRRGTWALRKERRLKQPFFSLDRRSGVLRETTRAQSRSRQRSDYVKRWEVAPPLQGTRCA